MAQVYDMLDDDGIFVFQVAGFRPHWQYEDLIWFGFIKHIRAYNLNLTTRLGGYS